MPGNDDLALVTARTYEAGAGTWTAGAAVDRTAWASQYDRFTALVTPRGLVLDLGCGAGFDALGLAQRGLRLIGIDVSPAMCRLAQTQPALVGRLAVADQRDLPFGDASFDAVWADGVLHHIGRDDARGALLEVMRVLRSGGITTHPWNAVSVASSSRTLTYPGAVGTATTMRTISRRSPDPQASMSWPPPSLARLHGAMAS